MAIKTDNELMANNERINERIIPFLASNPV
jgi:hypothetical protein